MQAGIIVLGRRSKQPCKLVQGGRSVVFRPPYRSKKNLSNIQKVNTIPYKLYYVPCVPGGGDGGLEEAPSYPPGAA